MKILILTALTAVSLWAYSAFCNGYKAGYKKGYCYGQGYGCISPITPICPIPWPGQDSWSDGHSRGFVDGMNAR